MCICSVAREANRDGNMDGKGESDNNCNRTGLPCKTVKQPARAFRSEQHAMS